MHILLWENVEEKPQILINLGQRSGHVPQNLVGVENLSTSYELAQICNSSRGDFNDRWNWMGGSGWDY